MRKKIRKNKHERGIILGLVVAALLILSALGVGLLSMAWGLRLLTSRQKSETVSLLAAEAGCERALFWMSQQADMFSALQTGPHTGSETLPDSRCDYRVDFHGFVGNRAVFKIHSEGESGTASRTVDMYVMQSVTGWDMGQCRIPSDRNSTIPVYYASGEIIDMPIHINSYGEPDDSTRDINIYGSPQFLRIVSMGESRYSSGGGDKYDDIIDLFTGGIYFDQPDSRIADESFVQSKVDRYRETTKAQYIFSPQADNQVKNKQPTVQLEFYRGSDGKGYVQITNNCSVRGYRKTGGYKSTWDLRIEPGSGGELFERYYVYGYHYIPQDAEATGQRYSVRIRDTEVTPLYGSVEAPPCGQIFVNGNVVIGSNEEKLTQPQISQLNVIQGKITVTATGNIWLADSVKVSDMDDSGQSYARGGDGMPADENPNALGLITQGVIKVIDPGLVEYLGGPKSVPGGSSVYEPIGRLDAGEESGSYHRSLPDPVEVEAALVVGGGGWGAENVYRNWKHPGRKEASGNQDYLIVRGTIAEAFRGVVGIINYDGFLKRYYMDERYLEGVLPSDIWLRGKYVPAPAGWYDYRAGM